jgi:putative ABC transport system permease protein
MGWRREVAKLGALFRRPRPVDDLDEEIRSHLEMEEQENLESGMTPDEAHYAALRRFGNVTLAQERSREMWGWNSVETLWQDLRFGLRMLLKNPGFTVVAVLTLALGIGGTTAIFSIVDAVLLHGTPYHNPAQLVEIGAKSPQGEGESVSAGDFTAWQAQSQAFEGLAAYERWEFRVLTGAGEPDEVWASPVSTNVFHLLGVNAIIGRTFAENETLVVVLSHEYWHSHFAADPKIIGKTLALDGKPYTVIGVAPADLEFPEPNTQVWVPLTFSAAEKNGHEHSSLGVIARLGAGVTLKQAQAAMDLAARRLAMQYPKTNAGWSVIVKPFKGLEIGSVLRSAVWALLGAVVFVLLIVCSNVTSMLLARGTTRQGEMAVRAALGAGRLRLIRQLLVEGMLLAGAASVAGLVLASWGLAMIVSLLPKYSLIEIPALHRISINLPVLASTVVLSLLTGIVVSLLPALRVSSLNLSEPLKQRGRTSGTGARGSRVQRALIAAEVALALVLLVGAGLMIQSFKRLETAPTGFNPEHVLTVRVPLVSYKYAEGRQSAAFYRGVLERIQAIPGVKSAGMVNNLPFTGFGTTVDFPAPPNSPGGPEHIFFVAARSVSPGYFQAMGIPLKEGRDFTQTDNQKDAPCVRIVNEAMARRYWSGEDPVGKQVVGACRNDAPALIVGVVADSKQESVDSQVEPEVYLPYAQHPFASFLVTFVIRTASNPTDVAAAVRSAVWEIDHDQPVIQIRTMDNVISESVWRQRVSASMLGVFAAIALVLSAVGIYGVFSYSVSQRTHEIGIRAALGATRGDILWLVVGEGLALTLIGVGAGIVAALGLTRLLAGILYGIRPRDPLTFAALSLLLTGVALLAMYIPARRATKVDPMVALRYE